MTYEESMKISLVFVISFVGFIHSPRMEHDTNNHDYPYIFLKIVKEEHS